MAYKETLNLPKTKFPMKANLAQKEPDILKYWESEDIYSSSIKDKDKKPFILHDGPPYANGDIHLGHTLNKILKDIVVKYKTMRGYWAPYVPGWDCHGQPIDHQVEKLLDGKKVSIVEFRKKCRNYALRYVKRQADQFKRLGVRGNYEHPYLTLDRTYESVIVDTFGDLYKKGLIYQGLKPVYWCYHDQTALAEAEIEYQDEETPSIYVKFPLISKFSPLDKFDGTKSVVIWTTTPWTLPANVAVAVHPKEEYSAIKMDSELIIVASRLVSLVADDVGVENPKVVAKFKGTELVGLKMAHPLMDRESVMVDAEYVTLDQGTGCVHIAPGHGQEDYMVGLDNDLDIVMPVDDTGTFTDEAGKWAGLHIWDANPKILTELDKKGILLSQSQVSHSYPHCWRCKEPVIFRATKQWFVSLDKGGLRKSALEAIRKVHWVPAKGEKRITAMVEERPDWCISRQRQWGVPLPIFYCQGCEKPLITDESISLVKDLFFNEGSDAWFDRTADKILPAGTKCSGCGGKDFRQGADILDVWFESGSSHAAVLRTRDDQRWPADLYLEGSDQHRGWFQLSLLVSVGLGDEAPYKGVLTHGFTVDGEGRKMSKSLGNVIDPMEVVKSSGADILRLWNVSADYASPSIAVSSEILDRVAESYRRIRNTIRFLLGNLADFDPLKDKVNYDELEEIDRWALLRLNRLIASVTHEYDRYLFHQAYRQIYNFCIVDLSAFYLDVLKDRLYTSLPDSKERRSAQTVMFDILLALTRMIAPILSFTAEEIWQDLQDGYRTEKSVELSSWPHVEENYLDEDLEKSWDDLLRIRDEVLKSLETARVKKLIGNSLEAKVEVYAKGKPYQILNEKSDMLTTLMIVSQVELNELAGSVPEGVERSEDIKDIAIKVVKAEGEKCARCWNYRPGVGEDREHKTLCTRCAEIVRNWPS